MDSIRWAKPESELKSRSERVTGSGISNYSPKANEYKGRYLNTEGLSGITNSEKLGV